MHSNATYRGRADILKRPNRLNVRSGSVTGPPLLFEVEPEASQPTAPSAVSAPRSTPRAPVNGEAAPSIVRQWLKDTDDGQRLCTEHDYTVPDGARLPQWAIDGYLEVTQQSAEAERQQLIEQANAA